MRLLVRNKAALKVTMVLLIILPVFGFFEQIYFLNFTKSMPIGIYKKLNIKHLKNNDIVVFSYQDKNVKLLKHIVAGSGDELCYDGIDTIWRDTKIIAKLNMQKFKSSYLENSYCFTIKDDELFVLGEHPDSFDSRYFGPIKSSQIIATVKPILLL